MPRCLPWVLLFSLGACSEPPLHIDPDKGDSADETGDSQPDTGADTESGQDTANPVTWVQVQAARIDSCGLRSDGTGTCWGKDEHYQSSFPAGFATRIAVGDAHVCILVDGRADCWGATGGDDGFGQTSPPQTTLVTLASGTHHVCGLGAEGAVTCWGRDDAGQASPPGEAMTHLTAGELHTCGLTQARTLACWGSDNYGEVSDAPSSL